jgi:dTDP-glucose 4,6-dehydratase
MGFIGSNFVRMLLGGDREVSVTCVDNLSFGSNPRNLDGLSQKDGYKFLKGDISDIAIAKRAVQDADALVNFAAQSHVDRSIRDPWPFASSNILGVLALLEAVRKSRNEVRFLQIGSDEEYGEILTGSFKEGDPLTPSSPYAASKASASMLVLAYMRTYGLKGIITRCTNNFGPYQFPEKFIPLMIVSALLGRRLPIYGDGKQVRNWIYVEDHCRAIEMILAKGRDGEIYNVASDYETTNIKLAEMILKSVGKPTRLIRHVPDRPGHDRRYGLDSSKLRRQLGWRPRWDFPEALEKTIRWYGANEDWWKPLLGES